MVTKRMTDIMHTGILVVTGIVFTVLFLGILNMGFVELGQEVTDVNQAIALEHHVKSHNLSVPFPDTFAPNQVSLKQYYRKTFSQDLSDFHETLSKAYRYENGTYDCKYWSYVWTLYHKENKDRYGWNIDYITTDNHVFVMTYNETGYCIMDQNRLDCTPGMMT